MHFQLNILGALCSPAPWPHLAAPSRQTAIELMPIIPFDEQSMTRLSLIRFGTYAILIFAAFSAMRMHYVIPVHLPQVLGPDAVDWFGESDGRSIRVAHDGQPGFGDTVLSGSAVLKLAEERVKKDGISFQELDVPKIGLEILGTRLQWRITREVKRSLGDGTIWVIVFVDDKSGETRLERYRHPEPQKR